MNNDEQKPEDQSLPDNRQQPEDDLKKPKQDIHAMQKQVEELNARVEELLKEKDDLFQKLQRLGADYANFQKRAPRQIAESIAYEKEAIVKSLLPAFDNFDHALVGAGETQDCQTLVKGMQIIYDHMLEILKGQGVERIDSQGEVFDPSVHQALMQRSDPQVADGVVIEEYQKAYTLNGRVIRPAKVVVNKLPDPGEAADAGSEPAVEPDDAETKDTEPRTE